MNRAHHVMKTLPQNIADNEDYQNCEFILLDYNSTDGLEQQVREHLLPYIQSGKLTYYKTLLPAYFHRGHSLNSVFRLSTGDVVCTVDADNYIGKGFAAYVNSVFNAEEDIYLTVDTERYYADVCGRVCSRRSDFFKIGGYDETMDSWGHDDDDIKNRLNLLGLKRRYIEGPQFLDAISHGHEDRLSNEYMLRFLKRIFLCHVTPATSYFLMLLTTGRFLHVVCVNQAALHADRYDNALKAINHDYPFDISEHEGMEGQWSFDQEQIKLVATVGEVLHLADRGEYLQMRRSDFVLRYYEVKHTALVETMLMFYSYAKNRIKMEKNAASSHAVVNNGVMGKGIVYRNFDCDHPIVT